MFAQVVSNGRNAPVKIIKYEYVAPFINQQSKPIILMPFDENTKEFIPESLFVDGRMGVGYSMTNGATLNSTLVCNEDNISILFDDSSILSGYPLNDWSIQINDHFQNGDEYFAIKDVTANTIPFKIVSGLSDNALFVGSYGRIGFGTSNPMLELHIADGDTPSVRLDQDGTSGWAAQVWDIAANETNFFVRDVTNGSKLPFRIGPSTPTSTLTLREQGFVGIGTWTPTTHLDVKGHIRTDSTFLFNPLTEMPENTEGCIYLDGNDHKIKYYNGTSWVTIGDSHGVLDANLFGTVLQLDIQGGTSISVDLQPLIADLETRVSALEAVVLGKEEIKYTSARLFQNAPNPYKNTTAISYFIPYDVENALLRITGVKGELIKDVEIYERGEGSLVIDVTDTENGTYFYYLIVDGQKIASKTLVKIE